MRETSLNEWVRKQQDYLRTYSWRTGAWIWLRFRNPGKSKRQEARLNAMEQWKIRLTPQASTVPLTPHSLPLRISSGFLQVTESTPPFSTKGTRNRCCFLLSSKGKRLPAQNTASKIRSEVFVRFAADHYESPGKARFQHPHSGKNSVSVGYT